MRAIKPSRSINVNLVNAQMLFPTTKVIQNVESTNKATKKTKIGHCTATTEYVGKTHTFIQELS